MVGNQKDIKNIDTIFQLSVKLEIVQNIRKYKRTSKGPWVNNLYKYVQRRKMIIKKKHYYGYWDTVEEQINI